MTEPQWLYIRNGVQSGPVSQQQLGALAAQGQLGPDDLVWSQGMPQWLPARSMPGLFAGAPPMPPPIQYASPPSYYAPPSPDIGQDAGMRMLLPVGRSGWAIAAGYLGLLSFVAIPAPLALIVSIIAIMHMKRNPKVHGMGRAIFGLVMGIIGSAALTLIIFANLRR